jgi:hypothetical protein
MSKATNKVSTFVKLLSKAVKEDVKRETLPKVGKFAVDIVVRRTRLGYGVVKNFAEKSKLKPLSPRYVMFRKKYDRLDPTTAPKKSNLTLTGQMLRSMDYEIKGDTLIIKPTGKRDDGKRNEDIAKYNMQKGRIFNRISRLEFNQVVRFYRKSFGDLLKLRGLIK